MGKVTPGGITDRLLTDYPNMYGELSAGSGLNALNRDTDFSRDVIQRHQDKLPYGSHCEDVIGRGPGCSGAQTIAAVRKLSATKVSSADCFTKMPRKCFGLELKRRVFGATK